MLEEGQDEGGLLDEVRTTEHHDTAARVLVTGDRDFERFPGLSVVDPFGR